MTNEDHVDRLLAISEGYRLARSVTAQLPAGTVEPAGSSPDPDDDDPDREELVDEYVQLTGERPEPAFLITKPFRPETLKAVISQALFFNARPPV